MSVRATFTGTDVDTSNDTARATLEVVRVDADASVSVVEVPAAPFVVGESDSFVVGVANGGPADLDALSASFTLFGDAVIVDVESNDLVCAVAIDGRAASCEAAGPVAAGFSTLVDVSVQASSAGVVSLRAATPVPAAGDPDESNNVTTVRVDAVQPNADVSVLSVVEPSGVFGLGEPAVWQVEVANGGPSSAEGPRVEFVVPDGVTIESVSADRWACQIGPNGLSGSCVLVGFFAEGRADAVELQVSGSVPGTSILRAAVSSSTPDPDEVNNTAATRVTVAGADVSVLSVVEPSGVFGLGEPAVWQVEVANAGPSSAVGPRVEFVVPDGVTIESVSADRWACQIGPNGLSASCVLVGFFAEGRADAVELQVSGSVPGTSILRAAVSSSTPDPDEVNNTAATRVTVAGADVSVAVSEPPSGPVGLNERVRFEVEVANGGPTDLGGIESLIEVSGGRIVGLGFTDFFGCSASGDRRSVSCAREAAVPAGFSTTVNVRVQATSAGPVTLTASTPEPVVGDPDLSNNTASVRFVAVGADVSVAVSEPPSGPVGLNERVRFEVEVANGGPTDLGGIESLVEVSGGRIVGLGFTDFFGCSASGDRRSVSCASGGGGPCGVLDDGECSGGRRPRRVR